MRQCCSEKHYVGRFVATVLVTMLVMLYMILLPARIAYAQLPPGSVFEAGPFNPPVGWDVVSNTIAFHEKSGDALNVDCSVDVPNPLGTHRLQFVCVLGASPYELTMGMLVQVSWDADLVIAGRSFPLKIAMTPIDLATTEIQSNFGFEIWGKEFVRPNPWVNYELENTYTIPYVPDWGLRIRVDGVTPLNGERLWGDDSIDFLNLGEMIPAGDEGTGSQSGEDNESPVDIPLTLTGGLRITGDEVKADIVLEGMYNADGTVANYTKIVDAENCRWYQGGTWTFDVEVPYTAQQGQYLKLSLENLMYLLRMEKRIGMELELFGLTVSSNSLDIWEYVGQWYICTDLKSNKLEIPIPVTQSAADLVVVPQGVSFTAESVSGISGAPHSGDPAVLDRITAHIEVVNQSGTSIPADPFKKVVTVFVDNLAVASVYLTSGFAGHETKTYNVVFWAMSAGTKQVRIEVNPDHNIGEVLGENNVAEKELNITRKWGSIELWLKDSQGTILQPRDVLDVDSEDRPRIYATEKYTWGAALYQGSIKPDGKVRFDLPAGLYAIFVRTKPTVNYLDTAVEINLHEATGVVPYVLEEITLPSMASVSGTVLDGRTREPIRPAPPLPGSTNERPVTASMGVYCTACNDTGRFNFTKVIPGAYTLKIEHPFYYSREISINLSPGQNLDLGDILIDRDTVFDTTGHLILEATSGGGGNIYTNSRNVKISAWAEDVDGIASMRFANDGEAWGAEVSSCPSVWTLRDEDGQRSVSVQFKDGAGNWSGIVSASIRLDRQGPTGSVIINNGEETTTQSDVLLTFAATDPAGGTVAAVSLSNDGTNWSVPLPYTGEMVWSLSPGYGIRTVYAKFVDACGNWSPVVSDSIDVTPSARITLESSTGMPLSVYTRENTVNVRIYSGIIADSPIQTQSFSSNSTASETTAAAQSFVPQSAMTICGVGLVASRETSGPNGLLEIELRIAPLGATIASSPADSTLVTLGRVDSALANGGFVDVTFQAPVTLEAGRVYFLVAKARPYTQGGSVPSFYLFGAWLHPDGNGNIQDAYPNGKLWIAEISGGNTYSWSSLDGEGGNSERLDLAFRLILPANQMRYVVSDTIPTEITTPWEPFYPYVSVLLPTGDGPKTVAFQLKHPSYGPSGESPILRAGIIKDTVQPQLEWEILGGPEVLNGRYVVQSSSMQLLIRAKDATSGMQGVRVGLSSSIESMPWLDYDLYALLGMIFPGCAKLICSLPTVDGPYDLCAEVRDEAGNKSSATICVLKDEFGPSISRFQIQGKTTLPDNTPCVNRHDIKVRLTASDSGAGITAYRLGAAENMSTTWHQVAGVSTLDTYLMYNLLPGEGLKTVYLQVKDATGKVSSCSQKVYVRTSGPAAPVLVRWADHPNPSDKNVTATWSACTDPVGLLSYQVQIAADAQFASIVNTQTLDAGSTSCSWTAPGATATYYFRVRAQNKVGLWSDWTPSDGLQIVAGTIGDAKLTVDGRPVTINGIVTASFEDCFYVETEDRTKGIRVEPGCVVLPDSRVLIDGRMGTTSDFERVVYGTIVGGNGTLALAPLGLTNKLLGGGDWMYDASDGTGQRGVYGGVGLNNIGLLVRISGKPTPLNETDFLLDDGSGPVLCRLPSGIYYDKCWGFVVVTGISSCYYDGMIVRILLRVRDVYPVVIR
jgi:hypothetical protein